MTRCQKTRKKNNMPDTTVPIKIANANISGQGGQISNATITGDATIPSDVKPPIDSGARPEHPILLPPEAPPGSFYMLIYCPNPPPPHWEWILFTPGSPPERPQPQPPEPPDGGTTPPGIKPFPPEGGWGFAPPWGWVYWPGPEGAGPKK